MSDKKRVLVKINNQEFTLVSTEEDEKYIAKLAETVDTKVKEVLWKNNKLSSNMAYILTALNMVDSLYKVQKELEDYILKFGDTSESNLENQKKELEELKFNYKKSNMELEKYKKDKVVVSREIKRLKDKVEELNQTAQVKQNEIIRNEKTIEDLRKKLLKIKTEIIGEKEKPEQDK